MSKGKRDVTNVKYSWFGKAYGVPVAVDYCEQNQEAHRLSTGQCSKKESGKGLTYTRGAKKPI